jgi:hypothetical protein
MRSTTYEDALREAHETGASQADDAGVMALFCESVLQTLVGAASPKLVFEGAQKTGLTAVELNALCLSDFAAVHDLMWA